MKYSVIKIFMLALFFLSAIILGCGEKEETAEKKAPPVEEKVKEAVEEAKEEVKEAVEAVKEYTFEKKEEYSAKISEQISAMEKNIQELEEKAKVMEGEAKEAIDKEIAELKVLYENAVNELSKMKDSAADSWADAMKSLDTSMNDLEKAYHDAKAKYVE